MNLQRFGIIIFCLIVCSCQQHNELTQLFNGYDLSGWKNVNGAAASWRVNEQSLISTGVTTSVLRTEKQYENFILELEALHTSAQSYLKIFIHADALPAPGQPFMRSIECRITNTQKASISAIYEAKINSDQVSSVAANHPQEQNSNIQKWQHYQIHSYNGEVEVYINGKLVAQAQKAKPRKGYISIGSEDLEVHYKNIRIKELPSTQPVTEEIASLDEGFVSLYNGLSLSEWEMKSGHQGHWTAARWKIDYDGKSEEQDKCLWSRQSFKDFVLIADVKLTRTPEETLLPVVSAMGENLKHADGTLKKKAVAYAGDTGIYLRGTSKCQINIGNRNIGSGEIYGYRVDKNLSPQQRAAVVPKVKADRPPGEWNRFIITMKGNKISVSLNEQLIIDEAELPGIPTEGPIALQDDHEDNNTFQFANLYLKEL